MLVYQPQSISQETIGVWPKPIESIWQILGVGGGGNEIAPKLPHLSVADILFISATMSIPKEIRPWGVVTWMAEMFNVSRTGLYDLVGRVKNKLKDMGEVRGEEVEKNGNAVHVTQGRLMRTVLEASLPGKMAIRPLQKVLIEAFGESRSVGWISELLTKAGKKAGEVLEGIDASPLGCVIVARDETFLHSIPILMVIDPVSMTVLFAEALDDRQAETWGTVLLMVEDKGVEIGGFVEDMAKMYPKSQKEAGIEVDVQKDVWHIERDGGVVLRGLEKGALRTTKKLMEIEKKLNKEWDDTLFYDTYIPLSEKETRYYDYHAQFDRLMDDFVDALEAVDWRSGEIRDVETNGWLLDETLRSMEQIDHPKVKKWVKTMRKHQPQLLTAIGWLNSSLFPYYVQAKACLSPNEIPSFTRTVARHWRLKQAQINGHHTFKSTADDAHLDWLLLLDGDPQRTVLSHTLIQLLDATCRSSSLIEGVNKLLKQFLHNHQAFRSPETLQLYLNLFVLWHNMRRFERGKRQGYSPYQIAGIDLGTDDWLACLGYSAE